MQNSFTPIALPINFSPFVEGTEMFFVVLKLFIVLFFLLYCVFTFVVTRQVSLMEQTIETPLQSSIRIASWLYFGLSVVVFLMALLTL